VGIGTTTPDPAAALDVVGTGKGLLIPRLDSATRVAIANPPTGLMVFQTDGRLGFWYAVAGSWLYIPDKTRSGDNLGDHTATRALNLQANALTGTGSSVGAAVGVGITAKGGLNVGQNGVGHNVAVGYQAGDALTSGVANQVLGYQAGASLTGGSANYFSGYQAGYSTTNAGNNYFTGYQAGYTNVDGVHNHFSGYQAGYSNTWGSSNTFIGYMAGYSNKTGMENYFSGTNSGSSNTTGSGNYFSGRDSGVSNTTGSYNTYSGYRSGTVTRTGSYNYFAGYLSGRSNVSGSYNLALGNNAGPTAANLTNTVAIGSDAGVGCSNCMALGHAGAGAVNVGIDIGTPNSTLQVNGSLAIGVLEGLAGDAIGKPLAGIAAAYIGLSPDGTDNRFLLPDPVSCYGRVYYLRNTSDTAAAVLLIDSPTALFADVPPGTDPAQYELPATGSGKLVTAIATGGGWVIIRGS
jgi:hypothetical protein